MRIYIAGAYTANTEDEILINVNKAMDAGIKLFKKGHHPYVPHLCHWLDKRANEIQIPLSYQNYMDYHMKWLMVSDAVLLISHSKGADIEETEAKRLWIPIYYKIEDVPVIKK